MRRIQRNELFLTAGKGVIKVQITGHFRYNWLLVESA
jgi:hypothetical protein